MKEKYRLDEMRTCEVAETVEVFPGYSILLSEIYQKFREDCKTSIRGDFRKGRVRADTTNAEVVRQAEISNYQFPSISISIFQ